MSAEERAASIGEELVKREMITREEFVRAREREAATGTPWYRQLLQMGKISFDAVEQLLTYEFHPKALRDEQETLGQTVLKMGIISKEQLAEALAEQDSSGRLLGKILLERGYVTREAIMRALSQQHKIEYAPLAECPSEPAALETVPEAMARRNHMLPVRLEGDKLTVLVDNPREVADMRQVGILLGKRIYPMLTTVDDIRDEIAERYRKARAHAMTTETAPQKEKTAPMAQPAAPAPEEAKPGKLARRKGLEDIARQAAGVPVIKLVTTILEGAINAGATDIHLDPQEPEMRVRYRIDGILHDVMSIPQEIQNAVVSRVKILAEMDITETRHPQDGHMSLDVGNMEYDIRAASLPTYLGERIVLRLLDQTSVLAGVKDLGLEKDDEEVLLRSINQAYGMILVTGPTGSGKTTTLYSALNQKNIMTDSIVTLEDPVEYQLSGINQVQIEQEIGLTFANTLRAALRQDIDVLLVGEIRDPDTAKIAIRAAMTGHLVFSTLHTNDAPEAITTLRNMGIPSYLIASALTAVIGQRLVRQICPQCKKAYKPTKTELKALGLPETTKTLYKGEGCEACYHTGCKGRTGIFEILEVSPAIRKIIAAETPIEKITAAAKFKNMADRCRLKVKRGEVTAKEFYRVIRL